MKYMNRVQSEFEAILLKLSENSSTAYDDAYKSAEKYVEKFFQKKKLNESEKAEIFDLCIDLVNDWFPDTSSVELYATI